MITVGVVDVGSPAANNIGWAICRPDEPDKTGTVLDDFIASMAATCARSPAAIGFEAPMYVPFRSSALELLKARPGEGSRPWSAGAGAAVTAAALVVVPYILAELKARLPNARAWTDFTSVPTEPGQVLFFEAFVSNADKGANHQRDAQRAASALFQTAKRRAPLSSTLGDEAAFSLLGAAMMRTGWTTDVAELSRPCLVVRPSDIA